MKCIPDSGVAKAIELELKIEDPQRSKALEILNEETKSRTEPDNSGCDR